MPKIIVIGAGVSGVAAAVKLLQNGYDDFVLLESERRIGGRINSVPFGANVVDLGAQWCHGEKGNIVHELASHKEPFDSTSVKYATFSCIKSDKEIIPNQLCTKLTQLARECMISAQSEKFGRHESLGTFFDKKYNELLKTKEYAGVHRDIAAKFLEFYKKFENSVEASNTLYEVSARGYQHYHECEGDALLNWRDKGYKYFLEILLNHFPNETWRNKIQLRKRVERIYWDDVALKKVFVHCVDGEIFEADHVICTVSLGVLKEQHTNLFSPNLPAWKQKSIQGLAIGTVDKIFLEFDVPFWPEDWVGFNLLWEEEDLEEVRRGPYAWIEDIFGFYTVDYQPNVLCGWIYGERAKQMEQESDEVVCDAALYLLRKFLSYTVPNPVNMLRSKWYSNRNFRGSYSYRSIETECAEFSAAELAKPISHKFTNAPILLFAGEATHDKFYSTVHGACESGFREVQHLHDFYRSFSTMGDENSRLVYDVIILGAGLAGLGASIVLRENNVSFCILEAQNYVGGRVKTTSLLSINEEETELTGCVDIGAQWLHGDQNHLYASAKKYNLVMEKTSEEGLGPFIREDGYVFNDSFVKKIDFRFGQILEECEHFLQCDQHPKSIAHYVKQRFEDHVLKNLKAEEDRKRAVQLLDWHIRFQNIDNSCLKLEDVSAKWWGLYSLDGKNTQAHINLRGGFASLIDAIVGNLEEKCIKTETIVEKVNWDIRHTENGSIVVKCHDGRRFFTKHVIVTFSIGVLKEKMRDLFHPVLPTFCEGVINSLGFDPINKIFIQFPYPWWNDRQAIQLVFNDIDYKSRKWTRHLSGFDVLDPGPPNTLLGWVGGYGAIEMEKLTDAQIIDDCLEILSLFVKMSIPKPIRFFCTRWRENKFIRGGYSYISTKCDEIGVERSLLANPVTKRHLPTNIIRTSGNIKSIAETKENTDRNVLNENYFQPLITFAGEACHDKYFSTAHGAFHSGMEQAQKLLNFNNNRESSTLH